LKWFEKELAELEKSGGFAYVVGHIPPIHFLYQFSVRYQALLERYQHVIHFSSFAHTHYESFFVDKAHDSRKPIHTGIVHGSVTTFVSRDPQFYVFEWDEELMVPVNIHVYTMSIDEANKNGKPRWYKQHDFINKYNLKDLSPSSMAKLSDQMYDDINYTKLFEENHGGNKGVFLGTDESDDGAYVATLHDRFYKCLQEGSM